MTEKFGFGLPRVHVGADARDIHANGFTTPQHDSLTHETGLIRKRREITTPADTQSAIDMWLSSKAERYAIDAVLINRVIDRIISFREDVSILGLLTLDKMGNTIVRKSFDVDYDFKDLRKDIATTMAYAHVTEMTELEERLEKGDGAPEVSAYKRASQWADFYEKYVPHNEDGYLNITGQNEEWNPGGPFVTYGTGVLTAASVMAKTLEVIPEVCKQNLDDRENNPLIHAQIARNSYPLLASLAYMGGPEQATIEWMITKTVQIPLFSDTMPVAVDNKYRWSSFEIKDTPHGKSLVLRGEKDLGKKLIKELKDDAPIYSYDIGCPAVIPVDGDPAIKKLWNWTIDIYEYMAAGEWGNKLKSFEAHKRDYDDLINETRSQMPQNTRIMGADF